MTSFRINLHTANNLAVCGKTVPCILITIDKGQSLASRQSVKTLVLPVLSYMKFLSRTGYSITLLYTAVFHMHNFSIVIS